MSWRPLLEGAEAEAALQRVDEIAAEIDRRGTDDPSLAGGWAGIALMHGYRAHAGCDDGADRAFAALERALAGIDAADGSWLFNGVAGIGFAVHHLASVVGAHEDVLNELDKVVAAALATNANARVDLTHGWIGLGVYARERGLRALETAAVDHVIAAGNTEAGGVIWREVDGRINLGLAHGQTGAIAFVAQSGDDGSEGLLEDAIRWLLAREQAHVVPRIPNWVDQGLTLGVDGWCHGDVATGLTLARAGAARAKPRWHDAGHRLVLHAARRGDIEVAGDDETSLCHGRIGRAHVLARAGNALADDEVRAAAHRCYRRALDDDILGGTSGVGVQLGLAGIALGLLAATCDREPAWDRAFLLS